MKKIIYTLSLIGILFSCGKEPIEIQRNNDTTWSVDKSITDDDIRERIGFDPLKENVYIKQSEIVFPSAYIGDVLVSTGAKQTVKVEVLQAAKTAIKVKLEYDTTVFDMVKEQYAGYELGEASLLPITESEKTINPGETSVEFEVNPPTMVVSKNLLVPFKATLVGNSDNVKISEKSNYAVAKLFSEKIEFNFLKEITKKIDFDFTSNKASTADSEVAIQVVSRTSTSVTLGLVRDDSAYSGTNTLAPAGIEGTIAKVTMEGTSATLKFDLTNLETIVAAGTYILPLKPVWYDKDNTAHTFTDTILVTLRVGGIGIKNATSSATQITLPGTIINKKEVYTGFFIDDDTGGASFMSDGLYTDFAAYFKSNSSTPNGVTFYFNEEKSIKGIRLKMKNTHTTNNIRISTYEDIIGEVSFAEGNEWYIIEFTSPLQTEFLGLDSFKRTGAEWFEIYEIDFYE